MASWKNSRIFSIGGYSFQRVVVFFQPVMLRFKWCKLDSRWWQLKYFLFTPWSLGKWSILTSIFFKWVGSTTNQDCFGSQWPEKLRVFLKDGSRWGGNGAQPTAGPVECRVRRQRCGTASDEVKTGRLAIGQGLRSWAEQLQRLKVLTLTWEKQVILKWHHLFLFFGRMTSLFIFFVFSGKRFFLDGKKGKKNTSSFANLIVLARNWLLGYQFMMTVYVFFFQDWLILKSTPWKFNIAIENIPSQKESSLQTIIFEGLC